MQANAEQWLVVGLGNPGSRYSGNRHNVGFMVADVLHDRSESFRWQPAARFDAELAKGQLAAQMVLLVKPQTYMNLSGQSVAPLAHFYRVSPERIVAVHDDVDLDFGRLRIKTGGGDGGHKGVRSMTQELGTPEFIRLRFGVGRPTVGDVTDYVLRDFTSEEQRYLGEHLQRAADAVSTLMSQGVREAMNAFNGPAERSKNNQQSTEENSSIDR